MKTARLLVSLGLGMLPAVAASGALFLNLEEDLRAHYRSGALSGEINSLGGSLRQVFADELGDRVVLFLQAEAEHNLSHAMLHQLYAQWKGPMGRWNVSLGRVPLPWGLLPAWSPDRRPYGSPYPGAGIEAADTGILFHGVIDSLDYGISLTQGYGMGGIESFPGPGLAGARLALTPGLEEDFTVGISVSAGTMHFATNGHGMDGRAPEKRVAIALDTRLDLGQGTWRFEGGGRHADNQWKLSFFTTLDYALLPWLTVETAGQVFTTGSGHPHGRFYTGIEIPISDTIIRGGYEYEKMDHVSHRAVLQLHRIFSAAW